MFLFVCLLFFFFCLFVFFFKISPHKSSTPQAHTVYYRELLFFRSHCFVLHYLQLSLSLWKLISISSSHFLSHRRAVECGCIIPVQEADFNFQHQAMSIQQFSHSLKPSRSKKKEIFFSKKSVLTHLDQQI